MLYRSTEGKRMATKEDRVVIYMRLQNLLDHVEGYGLTLIGLTVTLGDLTIEVSGDIPRSELAHLGLEEVLL